MSAPGTDLLPSNATDLEREMARLSQQIDGIDPGVIATVWNAWECPRALLPVLAWAMSVDFWDERWSEQTQRQAIADAPAYHRMKGTVEAVRRILGLFGCRVAIDEWFNQVPQGRRGTFRVTAYVTETLPGDIDLITPDRIRKAVAAVKAAKPKSRAFSFRMGVALSGRLTVASAALLMHVTELGGTATPARRGRARLTAASAGQLLHVFQGGGTASHRTMRPIP